MISPLVGFISRQGAAPCNLGFIILDFIILARSPLVTLESRLRATWDYNKQIDYDYLTGEGHPGRYFRPLHSSTTSDEWCRFAQ